MQRSASVFEIVCFANQCCDGAVKLPQHLLADRKFGIQRFLMPTGFIEPNQCARQIDEGDTFLAANLDRGGGSVGDRFMPNLRNVGTAADLGENRFRVCFWGAKPET